MAASSPWVSQLYVATSRASYPTITPPAEATAAIAMAALTKPNTVLVKAPATVAARYADHRRQPAAARARKGRTSDAA